MFEIGKSVNKEHKLLPITIKNTRGRGASFLIPRYQEKQNNIPNRQMRTEANRLSSTSALFFF